MHSEALRVFREVAESGSISGAAKKLHCVQSNVTVRLRRLEEELGVELVHRRSRGVTLTAAGTVLLEYAAKVLALLDDAERAVRESSGCAGPLSIGSMESTAAVRLPPVLSRFHREYPAVRLTLGTEPTAILIRNVLDRSMDCAFVGGPVEHPELICERLFEEELVLISGPETGDPHSLPEPVLLVFRKGCSYRAVLEKWALDAGRWPCSLMEFGSLDAILGCVGAGMGVAMVPRAVAERSRYAGKVRIHAVSSDYNRVPTCLIRRRDGLETEAMRRLAEMMRGMAGDQEDALTSSAPEASAEASEALAAEAR